MITTNSHVFRFADVTVHEREFSLVIAGQAKSVEPKAFQVLLILIRNPNKLITKEELLNAVWADAAVTENSLARNVALLRRILGDDAREPRYIETVTSLGYRWLCPVELVEEPPAVPAVQKPMMELVVRTIAVAEEAAAPRTTGKRRWIWGWASAIGAAVLLTGGILYLRRPLPPLRVTNYIRITHDGRAKELGGTDGLRLYFTERSPNVIAEVGVKGGESREIPIVIPVPVEWMELYDISPDGSNAVIETAEVGRTDQTFWIAPVLGGGAKRLDEGGIATFSPDGGSVMYSNQSGDIFTIRTDGTGKRKLGNVGSLAWSFRWSPDGKVIRFNKNDQIWEMSADVTGAHPLFPDWNKGRRGPEAGAGACAWSADGKFLFFRGGFQIWGLDERRSLFRQPSSVPFQLTSGPIRWRNPTPGKDGKTLYAKGATIQGELSRIDLKTGNPQPLLGGISAEFASYSPDGKFVAYVTYPDRALWRANQDGTGRTQLTDPLDWILNPRWSPDGKEIVFTKVRDSRFTLGRISAADGSPQWLLPEETAEMGDPNWSLDGKKVLFSWGEQRSWVVGSYDPTERSFRPGKRDLRILDLETRQVTILPGSEDMYSPRWSRDGRYVAAIATHARAQLQIFDFTSRQWHSVPVGGEPGFPEFSHDSRYVYYVRTRPTQGVFRIPVIGGMEERVVDITNWHITGLYGAWMSLDETDAPLVLRDTGTDDIYALTLDEK